MPIGNLTSQIFANIYLNELDRFIKHTLKVRAYLRYGDDLVVFENNPARLGHVRADVVRFLADGLKLQVNPKSDKIMKTSHGLKILGVKIWPYGRALSRRNEARVKARLHPGNVSSYRGVLKKHSHAQKLREFDWLVLERCHQYDNFARRNRADLIENLC